MGDGDGAVGADLPEERQATPSVSPRLFWAIKVVSGALLIAIPALWPTPADLVLRLPFWPGQVLAVLGCLIHLVHYRILRRSVDRLDAPARLVVDGGLLPWIRHPMYLGDIGAMLGFMLIWPTAASISVAAVGIAAAVAQAVAEDRGLRARFPVDFEAWSRRSGLLLPAVGRRVAE